jgi:uncharacterized membrane protein
VQQSLKSPRVATRGLELRYKGGADINMKTLIPGIVLLVLYVCFIYCVMLSDTLLPARMASHFNLSGKADGWMSRGHYMLTISIGGSAVTLLLVMLSMVCRFMPKGVINLQNRDYWLAPERLDETRAYISRHMLWFTSWFVCFFIGIHFSTVHANRLAPSRLPMVEFSVISSCFVAGTLIWAGIMWLHFQNPNDEKEKRLRIIPSGFDEQQ